MRILVVEDDKKLASFVVNGLKQAGRRPQLPAGRGWGGAHRHGERLLGPNSCPASRRRARRRLTSLQSADCSFIMGGHAAAGAHDCTPC
jgi:hypothetical protein